MTTNTIAPGVDSDTIAPPVAPTGHLAPLPMRPWDLGYQDGRRAQPAHAPEHLTDTRDRLAYMTGWIEGAAHITNDTNAHRRP